MKLLNWTQTYGPFITLVAVVVNIVLVGLLVYLGWATHKLQKAVEDDRQRVEVHVRYANAREAAILSPPRFAPADELERLIVHFSNLNDTGVFLNFVSVVVVVEGKRRETPNIRVERIVRASSTESIDVTFEFQKVMRHGPWNPFTVVADCQTEIKCAYHSRGEDYKRQFPQPKVNVRMPPLPE